MALSILAVVQNSASVDTETALVITELENRGHTVTEYSEGSTEVTSGYDLLWITDNTTFTATSWDVGHTMPAVVSKTGNLDEYELRTVGTGIAFRNITTPYYQDDTVVEWSGQTVDTTVTLTSSVQIGTFLASTLISGATVIAEQSSSVTDVVAAAVPSGTTLDDSTTSDVNVGIFTIRDAIANSDQSECVDLLESLMNWAAGASSETIVTPSAISAPWTVNAPAIPVTTTLSAISVPVTLPAPTVVTTADAMPGAISTAWAVNAPTVEVIQDPEPSAISAPWTVNAPTPTTTASPTLSEVALSWFIPIPAVNEGPFISINPTPIEMAWTVNTPDSSTATTLSVINVVVSLLEAQLLIDADITPGAVSAPWTVNPPASVVISILPATITTAWEIVVPTIPVVRNITLTSLLTAATSVYAPTIGIDVIPDLDYPLAVSVLNGARSVRLVLRS